MFIEFKNVKQIHYIGDYCYIIFIDGCFTILDNIQTYVVKSIIESNYEYKKTIEYIKGNLEINEDEVRNTVDIVLNDLKNFLVKNTTNNNSLCISGKSEFYFPESVQISLTNICKHRCKHCYKGDINSGVHLDYDILSNFLTYISPYCKNISFTGGEAFEYKNIEKLLDEFGDKFDISINTCGYFNKKLSIDYYEKFSSIQVTLYGSNDVNHDNFVGIKGSFDKVIEFIKFLVKHNINVLISYQVKSDNISEVDELVRLCIDLGVSRVMIGEIIPTIRSKENGVYIKNNNRFINIKSLRETYGDKIDIVFNEFEDIVSKNNYFFKCYAGFKQWHVVEDGRIVPCALIDYDTFEIGNILNKNSYISLIKDGSYDSIQDKWLNNKLNIFNHYKKQGFSINDICNKIITN